MENHNDYKEKLNAALTDTASFYFLAYTHIINRGLPPEAALHFADMMMSAFILPKKEEPFDVAKFIQQLSVELTLWMRQTFPKGPR